MNYQEFAAALCSSEGWPASQPNTDALVTVFAVEDSQATWNPEDTEEPEPGATNYNPQGVKDYPGLQTGEKGFHDTIHNGNYPQLVTLFKLGDSAERILSCTEWDTWAGGDITTLYGEVLKQVQADRAGYYSRHIAGSPETPTPPTPQPTPGPAPAEKRFDVKLRFLRHGDTGPDVQHLQQFLRIREADPNLSDDGHFGPATEQALRSFQRYHHLEDDGVFGPDVMEALWETTGPDKAPGTEQPRTEEVGKAQAADAAPIPSSESGTASPAPTEQAASGQGAPDNTQASSDPTDGPSEEVQP